MITIQEDRKLRAVFLFGRCALLVAFTQELADGRIELGDRLLKRPSDFLEFLPRLDLDMLDRDRSRRNGRLGHANLQKKSYCMIGNTPDLREAETCGSAVDMGIRDTQGLPVHPGRTGHIERLIGSVPTRMLPSTRTASVSLTLPHNTGRPPCTTAKTLGIDIPQTLLAAADQVID
jgi:hypothetical protein